MRILEVKFLVMIVALLSTIAGVLVNEKRVRDNEKLAQEKHRIEVQRALRTAPVIKMDGMFTAVPGEPKKK